MANRDGKLIERTLKDFSLNISTDGGSGSGGDGYGIIKEACEFENKYRKKAKEALMSSVGSNSIQPCFSTIQDFLSFLKELGVDENKKYTTFFVCFARQDNRDNALYLHISIDPKDKNIGLINSYLGRTIPFYQEWSEEDSTFKILERSFTDEFLDSLYIGKAGSDSFRTWFNLTANATRDITYSPFIACEYFDEEDEIDQIETYKLDYNVLLKWMTLKPVYITPGR